MALDIVALRSETVGCTRNIHFNNAGASLMPDPVWHETIEYIEQESLWGGYETACRRRNDLDETYRSIASFIHADPDEIAIQENATMAWNMAFSSIDFNKGDRILTSVSEYASNFLGYLHLRKKMEISIEVIPNDEYGQISVDALSEMMDERVRLISITHIPTNNGLVNPAEAIGKIVEKYDCLYLLDACQSIGQYPVDVRKIGCHMLSATGRKYLRAPRGTGFLYVDRHKMDTLTPPFPDLHSAEWVSPEGYEFRKDARKFENWESNYAGIAGLNTAVKYADGLGIEKIWDRVQYLANHLREALNTVDGVTVWDTGRVKSGIVTFTHANHSATDVQEYLFNRNINVSVSPKNSTLIDMNVRNLDELVRASVHYFNTEKETEILVRTLGNM